MNTSRFASAFVLLAFCGLSRAQVVGTPGNDVLNFQFTIQNVNTSIVNAYTGQTLNVAATFAVNAATYDGLAGTDVLNLTANNDFLAVRNSSNQQTLFSVERYIAGAGSDVVNLSDAAIHLGNVAVSGGESDDILWANAGNDLVNGGDGNDLIDGGPGNDTLNGELGNDTFTVTASEGGQKTISGGADFDSISFLDRVQSQVTIIPLGPSEYTILYGGGNDVLHVSTVEELRFADGSSISLVPVPEPSTAALIFAGLGLMGFSVRRRRAAEASRLNDLNLPPTRA